MVLMYCLLVFSQLCFVFSEAMAGSVNMSNVLGCFRNNVVTKTETFGFKYSINSCSFCFFSFFNIFVIFLV